MFLYSSKKNTYAGGEEKARCVECRFAEGRFAGDLGPLTVAHSLLQESMIYINKQ